MAPLAATAAAAFLMAACVLAIPATASAQTVVVMVNGEPITALDIEQRTKFIQMSTHKAPARQEVIDGLINEILEIEEAKKFGIEVPKSDVEEAYANVGKTNGCGHAKAR